MARKRKPLKQADINKNSSAKISHTIKRIKENERKYTTILVFIFIIMILFITYKSLKIDNNILLDELRRSASINEISAFSPVVTLTEDYIMSDEEGLKSTPFVYTIKNNSNTSFNYKILFVKDDFLTKICECDKETADTSMIHYSIDNNQDIKAFNSKDEMIVKEGLLEIGQKEQISIKMWFTNQLDSNIKKHFHGHFILEKE